MRCTLCGKTYCYHNSTTSLAYHLRTRHSEPSQSNKETWHGGASRTIADIQYADVQITTEAQHGGASQTNTTGRVPTPAMTEESPFLNMQVGGGWMLCQCVEWHR